METVYVNLEFKHFSRPTNSIFQTNNGLWHSNPFSFIDSTEIIDNLTGLSQLVNNLNQNDQVNCITILEPVETSTITVVFKGSKEFINYSRSLVLQSFKLVSCKIIAVNELQVHKMLKSGVFLDKLAMVSQNHNVEVVINNQVNVYGNQDDLTIVETEIRILIDSMINGLHVECMDVNLSILPIIGGCKLGNFNEVAKQSNSNIYLPDLLPELYNSQIYHDHKSFKIWFTGSKMSEILVTKKLLNKLVANAEDKFYHRTIEVSKEKLDLIMLNEQMGLLNIMFQHGCFIQVPKLGDSSNTILIQSNNVQSITDTIESIHFLTSKYYKVLINNDNPMNYINMIDMTIGKFSCSVKVNFNGIEIVGKNREIKQFLTMINSSTVNFKAQLAIEVNNDQKDFISGKKNGKMLKVLSQITDRSIIKYLNYNEHQFLLDLVVEQSISLNSLIYLMELIENELPSELKFNVPEIFHKSIIGNGGLIIQSIMKKYNVYIKFSSQNQESEPCYNFKRMENVLIKCPSKNSGNIQLVKQEIDNLVINCCENNLNYKFLNKNLNNSIYNTVNFRLLKSHYLLLINGFKMNVLVGLELEHQSYINWPKSYEQFEGNVSNIDIKGSDIKLKFFINNLIKLLPRNYKFVLSNGYSETCAFNDLVTHFRVNYDIETLVMGNEIWLSFFDSSNVSVAVEKLGKVLAGERVAVMDRKEFEYNPLEIDLNEMSFDDKKKRVKRPLQKVTNRV